MRILTPVVKPMAGRNISRQYKIQKACWIGYLNESGENPIVLQFKNTFKISHKTKAIIHVSADNRYELFLNGQLISMGPDRSDLEHWSFASYKLELSLGTYTIVADVSFTGNFSPGAQIFLKPGFIFAAEGELENQLDTGKGNWKVRKIKGYTFDPNPNRHAYFAVGAEETQDGGKIFNSDKWEKPVVITKPVKIDGFYGEVEWDWVLIPTSLPEQRIKETKTGKIRAVIHGIRNKYTKKDTMSCDIPAWQNLITSEKPITIPANKKLTVLLDLEDYYCAYPVITLSRGNKSKIIISWSEALTVKPHTTIKNNRNEIINKYFKGLNLNIIQDSGLNRTYKPLWWRAGRYIQFTIQTKNEPLTINKFVLIETRYPLENQSKFTSSDKSLESIIPMAVRGLQMCEHETFMDCPFYEQLQYGGDTRIQMLVHHLISKDSALIKRGIELFERSSWKTGFVGSRYPCRYFQLILNFSMIWIFMIHDYYFWKNEPGWVKERMVSIRNLLEHFRTLLHDDGLLHQLPGWPFMDWAPEWPYGDPPGSLKGISSIINLLFVNALMRAADLESRLGHKALAKRNKDLAQDIMQRVIKRFRVNSRNLFADDLTQKKFSEHAQCLALLSGLLDKEKETKCFNSLITEKKLTRTTIYFSYYLLEVFRKFDRGDLIVEKMDFWKDLAALGLKTPLESPGHARSDCHAWGSHPLFHFHASLTGIRPAEPGFKSVIIKPSPGPLKYLYSKIPHPNGYIVVDLKFDGGKGSGVAKINLPKNTPGKFIWKNKIHTLGPGKNVCHLQL